MLMFCLIVIFRSACVCTQRSYKESQLVPDKDREEGQSSQSVKIRVVG